MTKTNEERVKELDFIHTEWGDTVHVADVVTLLKDKDKELQKAREEERKIIKLRIDYDRRKGIPAEETVNDIYDSIELKDQSELDQPNK